MVQFTKKLIDFGGSKCIVVPAEIVELLGLHRGDFVTLDVINWTNKVEKK